MKSPSRTTSPNAFPGAVNGGMPHPGGGVLAWLRVDPAAAARFELRGHRHTASGSGVDLRRGISRWRRALVRRRALVLLRRYVLLGATAALLAAIGIGLAGGDRRSWWLLAPLAVALAGAAIAMSRRVTLAQTAMMFDSGLGLRNRVATAVELSDRRTGASPDAGAGARASAELAARVTGEASTAVAESFGTVRLRSVGAPLEWLALGAVALALGLVLALAPATPVAGSTRTTGAGRHAQGAQTGSRAHGHHLPPGAHLGVPRSASAAPPVALSPKHQLGLFNNPYISKFVAHQLAKALSRQGIAGAKNAGTRDFKSIHAKGSNGASGQPGLAGGKPPKSGPSESLPSRLPGSAGGLGNPTKVPHGATPPSSSGASPANPSAGGKAGVSKALGRSQGANGSGRGTGGHAGGSSGGGQAGSTPGSAALGPGLAPDLPHGSVGLPLQAGYAPSLAKHAPHGEGTSQTPNGSGHGGRTAVSNGASRTGGTGFAVIPPSSDAGQAASQTQRDNYFGVANQLQLKSWR